MLEIMVPSQHYEFFDEAKEEFINVDVEETKIQLEHSLISLYKWEQKWHKPFLSDKEKTYEEMIDYIRCMTLSQGVDSNVYEWIPKELFEKVVEYIKDPMTASWITETKNGAHHNSREAVTAEIIYYWMITLSIPMEFQERHLNQLFMLIKITNIKNQGPQKVDPRQAAAERAALNKKRRAQYQTKG